MRVAGLKKNRSRIDLYLEAQTMNSPRPLALHHQTLQSPGICQSESAPCSGSHQTIKPFSSEKCWSRSVLTWCTLGSKTDSCFHNITV